MGFLLENGGVSNLSPIEIQNNASFVFCHNFSPIKFSPSWRKAFLFIIIVLCSLQIIRYIIQTIKYRCLGKYRLRSKILSGKRDHVKQSALFEITDFLYSVSVIIYIILNFLTFEHKLLVTGSLRFFIIGCGLFSVGYYTQLSPIIGHFIIVYNRMLGTLVKFSIVYGFMQALFVGGILIVMNTHTQQGCVQEFSDIIHTWFTLFRTMLNMVDMTQYDVMHVHIVNVFHLTYVVLISILLLNFLIAVMAFAVTEVKENSVIIMDIQKLMVLVGVEECVWSGRFHHWLMARKLQMVDGRMCLVYSRCLMR